MSKQSYYRYIKCQQVVEKVVVIGPMEKGTEVMLAMQEDGWRVTSSGPYSDREMFPKLDMTRFRFIAERVHE